MNRSGWEMHYVFPNYSYLRFVRDFLSQSSNTGGEIFDPFSINAQFSQLGRYVHRQQVELEISHPVTRIITGKLGAGKSSLLKIFLESGAGLSQKQRLMVNLSLAEIQPSAPEEDVDLGKVSLLTTIQLIRNIFNAYWNELFLNETNRSLFYPQLRQSRWWTERLHWFYTHSKPYSPDIPGQFELMAWLGTSPSGTLFSPDVPSLELLRNMIDFVLFRGPRQEGFWINTPQSPFNGIQVFVDDLEILSSSALKRLIRDAQGLYEFRTDSLWFTLFADEILIDKLMDVSSVSQGIVGFYKLPPWSPDQLHQLINLRLGFPEEMDVDIGTYIPDSCMESYMRKKFVGLIIEKALELAKEENSTMDAPIHLLRLLRASLTFIADRYYSQKPSPITLPELQEIIQSYQRG